MSAGETWGRKNNFQTLGLPCLKKKPAIHHLPRAIPFKWSISLTTVNDDACRIIEQFCSLSVCA
jgi:hypothetical protein